MTINSIINRLKEGNKKFISFKAQKRMQTPLESKEMVYVQNPKVIVLGCSDSRVVPEFIFDTSFGDLFVVRIAGNIASSGAVESIEFSVSKFKSKVIVVLSHQNCGAVTEAVDRKKQKQDLGHLLSYISPAMEKSNMNAPINDIAKLNAKLTATELYENSKLISDAVNKGELKIVSAYYNLDSGKVDFL